MEKVKQSGSDQRRAGSAEQEGEVTSHILDAKRTDPLTLYPLDYVYYGGKQFRDISLGNPAPSK